MLVALEFGFDDASTFEIRCRQHSQTVIPAHLATENICCLFQNEEQNGRAAERVNCEVLLTCRSLIISMISSIGNPSLLHKRDFRQLDPLNCSITFKERTGKKAPFLGLNFEDWMFIHLNESSASYFFSKCTKRSFNTALKIS